MNGTLFFTAETAPRATSCGRATARGRARDARDIAAGRRARPTVLTNVGGTLFFRADDQRTGVELWKSDGTTTARGGSRTSAPARGLVAGGLKGIGNLLFFGADDGVDVA